MPFFDITSWSMIEYFIGVIFCLYIIKGIANRTSKSVICLIFFPIVLCLYIVVARFIISRFIIPESFVDIFKVFGLTFLIVVSLKFLLIYIISACFKRENHPFFKETISRFPGVFAALCEAFLMVAVIFWSIDYFDFPMQQNYPEFYKKASNNKLFEKVNILNPIYDIKGAKNFKIIFTVLSIESSAKELFQHKVYDRFIKIPMVNDMMKDKEFQKIIEEKDLSKLLLSSKLRNFLQDPEIYSFLTSDQFIKTCRSIIPRYHRKLIEEREGLLSDLNISL